ncbi:MAG: AMMECR1 domain-containing protein [bacterium]|nr:AMMECR1 domain-containing protein [bacterium]
MDSNILQKIAVVLPAYNEADFLAHTLMRIREEGFLNVVVSDDGSSDLTGAIARNADAIVCANPIRCGKGDAIRRGLAAAHGAFRPDAYIIMDADGQHDPADLGRFVREWRENTPDLILGSRDLKTKKMPLLRRVWNILISRMIFLLWGYAISDSQSGFRLFSDTCRKIIQEESRTKGYAFETETLFWALNHNLSISQIPVRTIYHGRQVHSFSIVFRAIKILLSFLFYTFYLYAAILARKGLRWKHIALFVILFTIAVTLIHAEKNTSYNPERNFFAIERKAALEWLKEHSDNDAIVMSHWYDGHQIVAFADRRVVATTKVYPTESGEVAARYRDIASFFLTSNETDALAIAKKYGASYVFLSKNFPAYLCKAFENCGLAPSRDHLASWARNTTIAGLMGQGAQFKHFQKVWDSSRFIIYQIEGDSVILTKKTRVQAIAIARQTIEALLLRDQEFTAADFSSIMHTNPEFLHRHPVDVTVWINGDVRASRYQTEGTLLENLVAAARNTASDTRFTPFQKNDLPNMRLEIVVFGDDIAPLEPLLIEAKRPNAAKSYLLQYQGSRLYFLPTVFNSVRFENTQELLERLCQKGEFKPDCYRDPRARIFTFSVQDFIESSDNILPLSGSLPAEPLSFSKNELLRRLIAAGDWTIRNQRDDGSYEARINAMTSERTNKMEWGRSALAAYSLLRLYALTKDDAYWESAKKNLAFLDAHFQFVITHAPATQIPISFFIFRTLSGIEVARITGNDRYAEEVHPLLAHITQLYDEKKIIDLSVPEIDEGSAHAVDSITISDNQALMVLALAAQRTGEKFDILRVLSLADILREHFRTNRILREDKLSLASEAWLVNAFRQIYLLTKKEEYADFAFEVASWLSDQQSNSGEASRYGAFPNTPSDDFMYSRGTGKVAEALADAVLLAREIGNSYLENTYTHALDDALMWLTRIQINRGSDFWINGSIKEKMQGGLRHDALNPELWIDSASHFIIAGTTYLLNK